MKKLDDPEGFRTCSRCKIQKSITEFHKNPYTISGFSGLCKPCKNESNAFYRKAHPDRYKQLAHENYIRNLDKIKARTLSRKDDIASYQKQYRLENSDRLKSRIYERKYGISLKQYRSILASQDNRCGICGKSGHTIKGMAVDHNHVTGAVRGILCSACNAGVGMFLEDPRLLRLAATYIESFSATAV